MRLLVTVVGALALCATAAAKEQGEMRSDMSGQRQQRMAHCPSAVQGSTTRVVDRKDGVEVMVTAKSPQAQAEIRQRAQHQQRIAGLPTRGTVEHTGQGTGSGQYGYCPGMEEETHVTAEDVPGGVRMIVHAQRPDQVRKLQKTTRLRADALRTRM